MRSARGATTIAVLGMALAMTLNFSTASAATEITISGLQFIGTGEVHTLGVSGNQRYAEATDNPGPLVFRNLDPIRHNIHASCIEVCTGGFAVSLAPAGGTVTLDVTPGLYQLVNHEIPGMRTTVRVAA